MPVSVPFHLIRTERKDACAAYLLYSDEIADLLTLCGHIGTDPLPPIFPVEGGFLVIPKSMPAVSYRNALPLRRLSENLYLAVDAELVPSLHPDEAAGLTRERGLVFLPGNRCLEFNAREPLSAAALIAFPAVKRSNWQQFPPGPDWPDRLTTITYTAPDLTPDNVLNAGGEGIGEETPRPPKVNPVKTALGKMGLGLGKGIAALGVVSGIGAVGRIGAGLMAAAIAIAPRLSESLLGKQEAALRELLRKFREGKIEEALKNALPMGGQGTASELHTSDQLPKHNTRWSLANIFGWNGPARLWVGGADEQVQLANEYRKAAQAALERGDHRRAAFIYAKLLNEVGAAADILAKGGLHRDAAIVYRDHLKNPRWAAREFEAAGDCDEALRLFRQIGEHEQAGDLLRRMGEEDQAIEEYHCAARKLIDGPHDYLKAGELILRKTGRADLAGAYFAIGWRERSTSVAHGNNALPCATRLAEIYAFAEPLDPFWNHLQEVETWLANSDKTSTAQLFDAILKLAELPHLRAVRTELRNRSRLALAARLREYSHTEKRMGNAVSDLFGGSRHWPAAVVSDANFALRTALKLTRQPANGERRSNSISLGKGMVTAAVSVIDTGEVIVGFHDGLAVSFDPRARRVDIIAPSGSDMVEAIAVDTTGQTIVLASGHDPDSRTLRLRGYRKNESGKIEYLSERAYQSPDLSWYVLNPLIFRSVIHPRAIVSTGAGLVGFGAVALIPREQEISHDEERPPIFLILPAPQTAVTFVSKDAVVQASASIPISDSTRSSRIIFEDRQIVWTGIPFHLGWRPRIAPLMHPSVSWLQTANNRLEIAGVGEDGHIHWSEIVIPDGDDTQSNRTCITDSANFGAAAIWKPGMIIAVSEDNRVCWLRSLRLGFSEWAPARNIPNPTRPVACFASSATGEAIVIMADGEAVCMPVPQ